MGFRIFLSALVFLSLAGCATTRKSAMDMEIQRLETRIKQLEREAQQKDRKISDLEQGLDRTNINRVKPIEVVTYPEKKAIKAGTEKKVKLQEPTPKKIQTALKNAGFYKGPVDGKVGKGTKKAILDFQKANGLNGDGIVGKKTWVKLSKYLD